VDVNVSGLPAIARGDPRRSWSRSPKITQLRRHARREPRPVQTRCRCAA
jgi:hypothetical protein